MKKKITLLASCLLAFFTVAKAADVVVDPASTTLSAAYAAATGGDVLILMDGTYVVDGNITMTKAITIKAQNALKATISGVGFLFTTNSTGDLTIKDVVLDGTKTGGTTYASYLVDFNGSSYPLAVSNILIENCTITKYGNCMLRANRGECTCESFKINKCLIVNNGYVAAYPFFQMTKTKVGSSLELTNSTIVDFANEYIQNYSTTAGGNNDATFLFKNNTFFNTVTNSARKPFNFSSGKVYVQNNIFVKTTVGTRTVDVVINAAVTTAEFTSNVVNNYDSGLLLNSTGWSLNSGNLDTDPLFKDTLNNDFTLPTGSVLITSAIGDPRWYGSTTDVKTVQSSGNINYNGSALLMSEKRNIAVFSVAGQQLISAEQVTKLSVQSLAKGIYIAKSGSDILKFAIK